MKDILSILDKLDPKQRHAILLFTLVGVISAFVQSLGVLSVLPFISAIADFDQLMRQDLIHWIYVTFGFRSSQSFILVLGVMFFGFLVLSNVFLLWSVYLKLKIVQNLDQSISHHLFSSYLSYDYERLINIDQSEISKNILNEVQNFTHRFIMALFEVIIYGFLSLSIVILLLIIDPLTSMIMVLVFIVFYGTLNMMIRKRIRRIGRVRNEFTQKRFKLVEEVFRSIKLVKIHHLEDAFLGQFDEQTKSINHSQMRMGLSQQAPYYLMDLVLISSLFIIIMIYSLQDYSFTDMITRLSFFALAAYKVKPSVNKLYHGFIDINYYRESSMRLISIMDTLETSSDQDDVSALTFLNEIRIHDLSFNYQASQESQLRNVSLVLKSKHIYGLTGKTGAGKTTLIHVLMGLLKLPKGSLFINGDQINQNGIVALQKRMAYVPQDVVLNDDTIVSNIAFGIEASKIDFERVKWAAHIACIDDFIEHLPNGYQNSVGDNGVKLSGGQRQRIGLARAFYRNPLLIILDEATNALDYQTEDEVLNRLVESYPDAMVLMITHRIQSLHRCDEIIFLDHGLIKDMGTLDALVERDPYFTSLLKEESSTHG